MNGKDDSFGEIPWPDVDEGTSADTNREEKK
jgi:hypothetical protein